MEEYLDDSLVQYWMSEDDPACVARFHEATLFYPSRNRCPICRGSQMVKPHRGRCRRCGRVVCKGHPGRPCYVMPEQLCADCYWAGVKLAM